MPTLDQHGDIRPRPVVLSGSTGNEVDGNRMARRKATKHNGPTLFDAHDRQRERRIRRQRALFIPKYLTEAAASVRIDRDLQERAYQIAQRWADLETKGHLPQFKETSIDTQFLDQLFGEGLGYRVKTTSPDAWQLEHKFFVTGVGTADAALGNFPKTAAPCAMVELKGSLTDLDRDRTSGSTAVQQCWDYLNAVPACEWGVVSNFKTIRLYHRDKGTLAYEEFSLQELRERPRFNEFYCLFERDGLLASKLGQQPRALELLRRTIERQRDVGEELYQSYHLQRLRLIEHLHLTEKKSLDAAIRIAQKLLDRIIFIAFCEDRELLPENCLKRAAETVGPFSQARNPLWKNYLGLFAEVDRGGANIGLDEGCNGNLFKKDDEIDNLELEDSKWISGFKNFGTFDFSEEVNVEVLGHLFERSITELEKLRVGGLFALQAGEEDGPQAPAKTGRKTGAKPKAAAEERAASKMPKSAQRKRFGIYYTPPAFTGLIVGRTVDAVVTERFASLQSKFKVDPESRQNQEDASLVAYWTACLDELKAISVCDPACGSGAFLIRAYDALDAQYKTVVHGLAGAGLDEAQVDKLEVQIPDWILNHNLYGVDLSEQAVEITQLALWIRSARRNRKLSDLSRNIVWGNSLVSDSAVDAKALSWEKAFPSIFGKKGAGGFTCVIGNPPWERVKVQDREFFSLTDPATAEAVNASDRNKRIAAMPKSNPDLHASYLTALGHAQRLLEYVRTSERYPLTGKGDVNLYMLFAELARSLVAPDGLVGLLVPSGIATDDTTKDFFNDLMESKRLASLYDFENKEGHFEDVHRSFKFTGLVFGGEKRTTQKADFVFFARGIEDTAEVNKQRHIPLTAADMALLNPNTKTCPIFRTRRDADLTKSIYKSIPILIDESRKRGGNAWEITFIRAFDQDFAADLFIDADKLNRKGLKLEGNQWHKGKNTFLPLYEAKMLQGYDHRAAGVVIDPTNWQRQGQTLESSLVQHQNPEFCVSPRYWIDDDVVTQRMGERIRPWYLAFKKITSATNTRTMIAAFMPHAAAIDSLPLVLFPSSVSGRRQCCLLGNLNSFVYDYVARQKVGGLHLNFFIVEQLPTLRPDAYADKCQWSKRESLEHWISERVLKLSCTADDMIPLAKACDFKGSRGDGVHIWKEAERAEVRAELDAAYFHLYGIERDDAQYMLSTFTNTGLVSEGDRGSQQFLWKQGSPGEMILDAYDRLGDA